MRQDAVSVAGKTLIEYVVILTIALILGALVFGNGTGCLIGCNEDYSEGERVGIVSKLSRKGIANKTWEGQMVLGGLARGMEGRMEANVWNFTVREGDDESLERLQAAQKAQKPVVVKYKEWMIRPGCKTDSGYMVESVEFVKEEKSSK